MVCKNCGIDNNPVNKFCIKCGAELSKEETGSIIGIEESPTDGSNGVNIGPNAVDIQTIPTASETTANNQPNSNNQVNSSFNGAMSNNQAVSVSNGNNSKFNYFKYLIFIIIKPVDSLKDNENELNNFKNSGIIALIVSALAMVLNLIKTVISTGYVKESTNIWGETTKASFNLDLIKELNFVDLILKNFFIYLGIILAIAVVFYLGNLVIKKNVSFVKMLAISTVSFLPIALGIYLLGPVFGLIWSDLNVIFIIIGLVYALVLLYVLTDNELKLEGNIKVYFYAACLAILLVIGYFILKQILISSVTNALGDLFSGF